MLLFKKLHSLFFVFVIGIAGVSAQMPQQAPPQQMPPQQQKSIEVSDSEMEQFALAFVEIQSIEQQVQPEMVGVVEKEGLKVERFNEIMNAQQDPNQELDASEDELEKFASVNKELQVIQNQAQQQMMKVISDEGLDVNRYQEILSAVRVDPELQQKLQQHFEQNNEEK